MAKDTQGSRSLTKFACGCLQDIVDGKATLVRCRLHQAAPELLAACKALVLWDSSTPDRRVRDLASVLRETKKAIRKAEGESQ